MLGEPGGGPRREQLAAAHDRDAIADAEQLGQVARDDEHRLAREREAMAGKAVLMVSSYLPELLGVCDRIAVMRRGRLGPARPVGGLTERDVLLEATGA